MITHNMGISGMANRGYKVKSGEISEEVINDIIMPAERIEW